MNFIADAENNEGKKRYQLFEIKSGIDTVSVLIPLAEADNFENEAKALRPSSRQELLKLLDKYQGSMDR